MEHAQRLFLLELIQTKKNRNAYYIRMGFLVDFSMTNETALYLNKQKSQGLSRMQVHVLPP